MTRLLESERELTAVFAMSDTMAIGAAPGCPGRRQEHPRGHFPGGV